MNHKTAALLRRQNAYRRALDSRFRRCGFCRLQCKHIKALKPSSLQWHNTVCITKPVQYLSANMNDGAASAPEGVLQYWGCYLCCCSDSSCSSSFCGSFCFRRFWYDFDFHFHFHSHSRSHSTRASRIQRLPTPLLATSTTWDRSTTRNKYGNHDSLRSCLDSAPSIRRRQSTHSQQSTCIFY